MTQRDSRLVGGIYRIGQVLIAGPILTTCTAYDRNTNDVVGLSIIELPPHLPHAIVQQYLQGLEQRRRVTSPHVLHIHHWGLEESKAYIATDSPRGVTLHYVLDHENVDLKRALDLTRQIAMGVQALHEHNITGVDLRPQLITVDVIGVTDRVQVDDIGLRTFLNLLGYTNTQQPEDIGYVDPRYTPPEYINNTPIGTWSDIYQLGLLLFSMITGRLPFVGRNPAETGVLQSSSPVPQMSQFTHEVSPEMQEIVNCAMAKDPVRRFASVKAFITVLDTIKLPRPRSRQEQNTAATKTAPPEVNPTAEMSRLSSDITKQATLLEGSDDEATLLDLPGEARAYAYLRYEGKDGEVKRLPIDQKSVIVGRLDPKRGVTPDIDLSTMDPKMTVSRQHARIRYEGSFFSIEDLKSRNKTRVRDLALTPFKTELLQDGDTLFIGSVRLLFEVPASKALPPL